MKLIDQLDCFEIKHVLREKNREADRLANLAMDRGIAKTAPVVLPREAGGARPWFRKSTALCAMGWFSSWARRCRKERWSRFAL